MLGIAPKAGVLEKVMRILLLFVALLCVGLQLIILKDHQQFIATFFPGTEDPLALSVVTVVVLTVIEALILIVWLTAERFETDQRNRSQGHREGRDEIGQSSSIPRVRGESIRNLINAHRDRENAAFAVWNRYGWPFLVVALFCIVLAGGVFQVAAGGP